MKASARKDLLLTPARLGLRDTIARLSLAFTQFLEKPIEDRVWARLALQRWQSQPNSSTGIRANVKADLARAIAERRMSVKDVGLAADIVVGIWLQITRGTRKAAPTNLAGQALDAVLRGLGADKQPAAARRYVPQSGYRSVTALGGGNTHTVLVLGHEVLAATCGIRAARVD